MNDLVLQRFCRIELLGVEVEARLDLADEPVIEAGSLGQLLEYKDSWRCRQLVRRLLDDGRLSGRSSHGESTDNSAENSGFSENKTGLRYQTRANFDAFKTEDVFVETVHEQVGAVVRDVEKLWLTERACLLVATASETERAWQVRTALVDFFLAFRRDQAVSGASTNEVCALRQEVADLRTEMVRHFGIDARLRKLEQKRGRAPSMNDRPMPSPRP